VLITEVAYMDPVTIHCERCDGRRFKESVLAHRLRGRSVADVLEMSAEEAAGFFSERAVRIMLGVLLETGLGYLGLGQSLSTLSGGERQRIKLAGQLAGTGNLYVLDEPTTGAAPVGRRHAAGPAERHRRPGQHRRGHRAQSRGGRAGGLDHRPGPRGRQERR
jgi:excinuclease UvrABC ATPase subunit